MGCDKPWTHGVEPPPAEYANREPHVPVIVVPVALDRGNSACHEFFADHSAYGVDGCAMLGRSACLVVIPISDLWHGYGPEHVAAIYAHEKYGHCNGFVHGANGRGWIRMVK